MKKLLILLLLSIPAIAQKVGIVDSLQLGVQHTINQKYKLAETVYTQLATTNPNDPAPAFFLAAMYQSKMLDYESDKWRKQFFETIEKTKTLADNKLAIEPSDTTALYYKFAAGSYESYQLGRDKKYLAAIKLGASSISNLKDIYEQNPDMCEILLGLGSYKYWTSYLTQKFDWLPFVHDDRHVGKKMLKQSMECNTFSKWTALSNLAWIYIQETKYDSSIIYSQMGLAEFPDSRFYLWPMGDALFHKKEFMEACKVYSKILDSVRAETFNNHYNEIVLLKKMALCQNHLGENNKAHKLCMQALACEPHDEVKKRIKKHRKEIIGLLQKINQQQ